MGRLEKALLTFLAVCVAGVGWLSLQSASRLRARSLAAAESDSMQRVRPSGTPGTTASRPATSRVQSAHVSAAMVRSALPAPVRDIPALRREIASRAPGTYIDFMLLSNDSSIVRWPERYNDPVKVWIQPASQVAGWTTSLASAARDAFGVWNSIRIPVRFDFVSDSAAAEMVIVWNDHFSGPQVGSTKRFRDQHGWLGRAEIILALRTSEGAAINDRYLTGVVIHEIGHALGLDHSPSRSDIMADRNDGVFLPTSEDRSTLELLYSVPPGSIK